ncbi:MAG: SurA N-terminal domain-containing protein [Spirochaetes bacterium]|nr:SurA N-terminal domain-containing protein [Spirochaetota bacterium]
MFDSKHPVVKVAGYIIVGFFVLIIIISFGMPDFLSRMGFDQNTIAKVNGEVIGYMDFIRYRDTHMVGKSEDPKQQQRMIIERMIQEKLLVQLAKKEGIVVTEKEIKSVIRNRFSDNTGTFNETFFRNFLDRFHMGISDYYKYVENEIYLGKLQNMLLAGVSVSPLELLTEYRMQNAKLKIQYSFLSNQELAKRFASTIAVTDEEVDAELKKNPKELKDPKTDRQRIKDKLANDKLEKVKQEIAKKIDQLALSGRPFAEAQSILQGVVAFSNEFVPGDLIREKDEKGRILYPLQESKIFQSDVFSLPKGATSRCVFGFDGLYIFTPVVRNIPGNQIPDKEKQTLEQNLFYTKANSLYISLLTRLFETSKIIRNQKFEAQ